MGASIGTAAWSSDGTRIAWTDVNGVLWVGAPDGSNARAVTPPIDALGQIAWLPDDRLIYWANFRLFLLTPDRRSVLLADVAGNTFSLDASGTKVADGGPGCPTGCYGPIDIRSIDGKTRHRVGGDRFQTTSPSLSPDGRIVAFARAPCDDDTGDCDGRSASIWVSPTKGGKLEQITRIGVRPIWSPDGSRLLYFRLPDDSGACSLHVVPAGGGRSALVRRGLDCGLFARWAPDSRSIAAIDERQELVITDVATRRSRIVAPGFFDEVTDVAWSPDGSRLLVTASTAQANCWSLWLVSAKGGEPRVVRRC